MFGENTTIFLDNFCGGNVISEACEKKFIKSDFLGFCDAKSEGFRSISFTTLRWAYSVLDIATNFLKFIKTHFVPKIESSEDTIILHNEEECRWRSPF